MSFPTIIHNIVQADNGVETRVTTTLAPTVNIVFPSDITNSAIQVGDTFMVSKRSSANVVLVPDTGVTITSSFGLVMNLLNERMVVRKVASNLYEVIVFTGSPAKWAGG
jgi:hypothetical protein